LKKPLAIDLYCGLGGWAEAFLAEGYDVIGFDIERHDYGTGGYPGQLVLADVLDLHGAQFRNAAVIVASPPCTEPSYRAMPWKRAKALNAAGPPSKFLCLFYACFKIQQQACEAAGQHIPLIVENVKGAQPWVGRARWHFGSYYLWGDVPALMPSTKSGKITGQNWSRHAETGETTPHWRLQGSKSNVGSWFDATYAQMKEAGLTAPGRNFSSHSLKRKQASAEIAKIPLPLARHIARCFLPAVTLSTQSTAFPHPRA